MQALPAGLAGLGARIEDGGRAIAVDAPPGGSLGPAIDALAGARLPVADVETRRATLEDVFVSLLAGGQAGGGRA